MIVFLSCYYLHNVHYDQQEARSHPKTDWQVQLKR